MDDNFSSTNEEREIGTFNGLTISQLFISKAGISTQMGLTSESITFYSAEKSFCLMVFYRVLLNSLRWPHVHSSSLSVLGLLGSMKELFLVPVTRKIPWVC